MDKLHEQLQAAIQALVVQEELAMSNESGALVFSTGETAYIDAYGQMVNTADITKASLGIDSFLELAMAIQEVVGHCSLYSTISTEYVQNNLKKLHLLGCHIKSIGMQTEEIREVWHG